MRCFIAVELPDDVKKRLARLQDGVVNAKVKLVEEENLHITLEFIGDVDDEKVDVLIKKLEKIKFNKFRIRLSGVGAFPNINMPRVVWVGISEGFEELKQLNLLINSVLHLSDGRIFEPHVTIARVKYVLEKERFSASISHLSFDAEFEVNGFVLKKSVLSSKGPEYSDIKVFDLD